MAAFSRMVGLCLDVFNLFESLNRLVESEPDRRNIFSLVPLANRVTFVGLSCLEDSMLRTGAPSEPLYRLKGAEVVLRLFQIPIQLGDEIARNRDPYEPIELTGVDKIRLFERGFLAPLAALCFASAGRSLYFERRFFEMTPAQLASEKRNIYEPILDSDIPPKLLETRSIDLQESEQLILQAESELQNCVILRAASESRFMEKVIFPFYLGLINWIEKKQIIPEQKRKVSETVLDLDFQRFEEIPVPLYKDALFKRYICPLTHLPIRDPVYGRDQILYERKAILDRIRKKESDWNLDCLVEAPAIKALIDSRLEFHKDRILELFQTTLDQ